MAITIGRAGGALAPLNPDSVSEDARGIQVSGRFAGSTSTLTRMVAQMIPGLNNADEPVVPVLFDEDPDLNGLYRVRSASVDLEPDSIINKHFRWSVSLDAVDDRAAPQVDHILDSVLRTNSVSVTAAMSDPWFAIPKSTGVVVSAAVAAGGVHDFVTETGSISRLVHTAPPPFREVARTICRPEHWYRGAATVERKWGADWVPVVGRQAVAGNPVGAMGISNGIVRVRLADDAPDGLNFSCWDGGWESLTTVWCRVHSSPAYSPTRDQTLTTFTILRNSPEEVRVRISGAAPTLLGTLDLRLRRGSPLVEMRWNITGGTVTLGLPGRLIRVPNNTPFALANGGGGHIIGADAAGNRMLQMWPVTSSNTTASTWSTALGFLPGTWLTYWASQSWNSANLRNQHFASTAESARVVGA